MTTVRRWGLITWLSLAVVFIAVPLLVHPSLYADVTGDVAVVLVAIWSSVLVGGVMTWALVSGFGDRGGMDRRIVAAMDGHPIHRELAWLALFLGCFVLSMVLLSLLFGMYGAEIGADLAMSESLVSRLLFLFTLPMLVMDRSGITVEGKGTAMPSIALKVTEPWRWLGLFPAAVALAVAGYILVPVLGSPPLSLSLIGFVLAFAMIAVCEEIFFRGMLQTRLEILGGRWSGIMGSAVVFALTYAVVQPYDQVTQIPGDGFVYASGLALLTYGPAGVLYGYLWTCFRNTWLTVILRIGMFFILMPPDLEIGIV